MLTSLLSQQMAGFAVRLLSETATTFTLGWDPFPCDGFRFTGPAGRRSHTWDGSRTSVRFSKASGVFRVEPFRVTADATYERP